jgi:hypothetical protein
LALPSALPMVLPGAGMARHNENVAIGGFHVREVTVGSAGFKGRVQGLA